VAKGHELVGPDRDDDRVDAQEAAARAKVDRYQARKEERERIREAHGGTTSRTSGQRKRDDSSSDDEHGAGRELHEHEGYAFAYYRDDFYQEINLEALIKYFERNELEIQKSSMVAAESVYFSEDTN